MATPKLRILYSEDDLDSREMLFLILANEGFDVVGPDNAIDFVRRAREERFDAYLLDNCMPGLTGADICHQIREFNPRTPIILYSGMADQEDRLLALGAQAYVTKPGPIERLIEIIRSTIQASRSD